MSDPLEIVCEHGNEPSDSIKNRDLLDQLNGCKILEQNSALWSYKLAGR
jgi:hypothetical protein